MDTVTQAHFILPNRLFSPRIQGKLENFTSLLLHDLFESCTLVFNNLLILFHNLPKHTPFGGHEAPQRENLCPYNTPSSPLGRFFLVNANFSVVRSHRVFTFTAYILYTMSGHN